MLLDINHHNGIPIYRQIMDQVRRQIVSGLLGENSKLLSVRDLAAQIKVNPMTVSKAYAYLEMEGLLLRNRGVGLFIAPLTDQQKQQTREGIIEESVKTTIATARQAHLSKEELIAIIERLYNEKP
ncbi:MAG: GntR family transcriptional regulator [Phycisphaerae bacterium]|nr:GntR family transcriptional regulator [Phycisphaerae bacterium]